MAPAILPSLSPVLRLTFVIGFASSVSFYLLLSAVPLYAASLEAGRSGTGMTTGVLMSATIAAELVTPALTRRVGYKFMVGLGLLLLGMPAIVLGGTATISVVYLISFVRGLGFGILMVLGSALAASFAPRQRRAGVLGIYGVVIGVPAIVALPLGVWLVGRIGYEMVFVAGGIAALLGFPAVFGLPRSSTTDEPGIGILAGLRNSSLLRPAVVFAATALVAGIVVTFLPLAVGNANRDLAAWTLLAHAALATLARWWAGRHADRHGPVGLLIPAVACVAVGVLLLALAPDVVAVVTGMLIFGAGFGVAQNVTLAMMFDRTSPAGYGSVSAMWNVAYDIGLGVGAAGFGVLAAATSYPLGFVVAGGVVLAALAPAAYDAVAAPAE